MFLSLYTHTHTLPYQGQEAAPYCRPPTVCRPVELSPAGMRQTESLYPDEDNWMFTQLLSPTHQHCYSRKEWSKMKGKLKHPTLKTFLYFSYLSADVFKKGRLRLVNFEVSQSRNMQSLSCCCLHSALTRLSSDLVICCSDVWECDGQSSFWVCESLWAHPLCLLEK